ncbi:MAG: hypothetical protein ACK5MR_02010 [Cumulibacter sp.]
MDPINKPNRGAEPVAADVGGSDVVGGDVDAATGTRPPARSRRSVGPGRILVLVYGIFAVAAGARAGVQIVMKFDEAPVAYTLSAVAALIYLANAYFLSRESRSSWRVAWVMCIVELVGVVVVGAASYIVPEEFPDATVWSHFGSGYGMIPLVLPILGLLWLRRTRPQ